MRSPPSACESHRRLGRNHDFGPNAVSPDASEQAALNSPLSSDILRRGLFHMLYCGGVNSARRAAQDAEVVLLHGPGRSPPRSEAGTRAGRAARTHTHKKDVAWV